MALSSAEILGIAKHDGIAILDCDTMREAISRVAAIRHWLTYNDKVSQYEVSRSKTTVTVKRKD